MKRQAVSLFSGCGGLDLGLEQAGWEILAQVEMDEDAARTLATHAVTSGGTAMVVNERIEDVAPEILMRQIGAQEGEIDLLAGGPPCQPFTTHGLRQSILDRRANSLFPTYLEWIDTLRPKALLLENVTGMLSAALRHRPLRERGGDAPPLEWDEKKGSFLFWLVSRLMELGYSVSWGILEAADFGTPQRRQRAFLVATTAKEPCYLPEPEYGLEGLPPHRTLRDALVDIGELGAIQPLSDRKTEVYERIPAGGNWRDLPEDVQKETMGRAYEATGGKSGWWRRLSWDAPAPTILGMPDHSSTALIHPEEVRCLSVRECALLQAFPATYDFCGSPRSQYQQIGNAVPPPLGRVLGERLGRFLAGERFSEPPRPKWRKSSANRKLGTHGWCAPGEAEPLIHLHARVRPDHIWADSQLELSLG